jgi:hypothetical protein
MKTNQISWTDTHAISPKNSQETYQALSLFNDFHFESQRINFYPGKTYSFI